MLWGSILHVEPCAGHPQRAQGLPGGDISHPDPLQPGHAVLPSWDLRRCLPCLCPQPGWAPVWLTFQGTQRQ